MSSPASTLRFRPHLMRVARQRVPRDTPNPLPVAEASPSSAPTPAPEAQAAAPGRIEMFEPEDTYESSLPIGPRVVHLLGATSGIHAPVVHPLIRAHMRAENEDAQVAQAPESGRS